MAQATEFDRTMMQRCLTLARQGLGRTSPNPLVGAVIVQEGTIIGEGFHPGAGQPHAEVFALRQAAEKARGATLYVNLEPCNHYGRTPPCSEAIVQAGIKKVVVGMIDPNPLVAGKGIRWGWRSRNVVNSIRVLSIASPLKNPSVSSNMP